MHNAPSVSYPVGRCAFVGWFLVVIALSGLSVQLSWVMLEPRMGARAWWAWGLYGALWVCLLGHAVWRWWRMPTGTLKWHPASPPEAALTALAPPTGWWWTSAAYPDSIGLKGVQVTLRLNRVVVLRWRLTTGRLFWVCVQHQGDGLAWLALQRALMAHAD